MTDPVTLLFCFPDTRNANSLLIVGSLGALNVLIYLSRSRNVLKRDWEYVRHVVVVVVVALSAFCCLHCRFMTLAFTSCQEFEVSCDRDHSGLF